MKIEKISENDEVKSTQTMSRKTDDSENSDFQNILNENAMANFSIAMGDMDLVSTDLQFDLDTLNISQEDALFFDEFVKNPQFSINQTTGELINCADLSTSTDLQMYKSMSVSKTLFNMIAKAQDTQKPVRLDFDNNVTVIMKVDKEGKITAEFIPGDAAVEQYLKTNIPFLKQRFDEQNLAYNDLYYRQDTGRRYKERRNKGESHE